MIKNTKLLIDFIIYVLFWGSVGFTHNKHISEVWKIAY